eukprot:479237-Alexandrium_andersonii.AAC.1
MCIRDSARARHYVSSEPTPGRLVDRSAIRPHGRLLLTLGPAPWRLPRRHLGRPLGKRGAT